MLSSMKSPHGSLAHVPATGQKRDAGAPSDGTLPESEARLRGILETAADGIITIDEHGLIESFNPSAERIFGYTAQEVIGQNVGMLMPPLFREAHNEYIANYLKTGVKKIIGIGREVIGQRKDGSAFPMHLSVSEVSLGQRKLFTGIVHDLSDQKMLEKQVLQAERLATIGKMAAKVAHEIRNPLSSISLNVELLQDEIDNYQAVNIDEAQALLKSITAEIDRVIALTAEYLQFSRLPESQLSKGNIHRVIEEIVEFWRHELGQKKIEIEYHLPNPFSEEATAELRFDRVQIRRAMLNIIRNAIEAMPKGGTLRIWTEEKGRWVYVHIEDTGVGIPEDEVKKIFDPFFTTKDFGTGLGLAVVQQIVSEHGGEIICTSKVGQGTTFTIILPLDEAKGAK